MAFDYDRARATAERIVNSTGRLITLINDQGPADQNDPLGAQKPPIIVTGIKGVFVRPSGYVKLGESFYMDPGMWEEAEKIVLILPSLTVDYSKFTRIRDIDGKGYKIFKVEELRPGDIPILLYLGLKQ